MKKLEGSLSLKQVIIIGFSTMLGTGLFVTPGIMYDATGPSLFLAFCLGVILVIPAAMSMAELSTAMPSSGGIYVYSERTFGPLFGTIIGVGLWLSLLFKSAYALKGFGIYLEVFTNASPLYTTLSILVIMLFLNIKGVGKVAGTITVVVIMSLITIIAVTGTSLSMLKVENTKPFFTGGLDGFFVALTLGVGAFAGLTKLTAIAEEVKEPEKNLSKGILLSLFGVSFIYFISSFVFSAALSHDLSINNLKPLYTIVSFTGGKIFAGILAAVAILTLASMANAGILAASKFPYAMSRDKIFPFRFGKIHSKFMTPVPSIILSCAIIAFIISFLDVDKVAKLASVFIIQMFILVNLTVIALRESGTRWYKPKYKSPLYPFNHIFGIFSGSILLIYMSSLTVYSILMVGLPSFFIYYFYGRKTNRKGTLSLHGPRKDLGQDNTSYDFRTLESLDMSKTAQVIIPLFGNESSPETLAEVGSILANGETVEVVHITEVPEQTDIDDSEDTPLLRALRRRIGTLNSERNNNVIFETIATYDTPKTLFNMGERFHSKWLLTEWTGKRRGRITFNNPVRFILDKLNCHVVWFKDKGIRRFKKILVLVKPNEDPHFIVNTAIILAQGNNATLTIAYDLNLSEEDKNNHKYKDFYKDIVMRSDTRVNAQAISLNGHGDALIELSIEYDLLIFTAKKSNIYKTFFETLNDKILAKAACSVMCISEEQTN